MTYVRVTQRGAPPRVQDCTAKCTLSFVCPFLLYKIKKEVKTVIKINGKDEPSAKGKKLIDYLTEHNYRPSIIAIELNYTILPKAEYDTYIINDGDIIEIVSFMGGG